METEPAKTDILSAGAAFDEKSVIARGQSGDKEAFTQIVRQYQDRLYNTVYRIVNSEEDALDVCQDVFLKALGSIKAFRGDSSFLTYLYRIAFNESVNYRKQRKKMVPMDFKCNPHCLSKQEINQNNTNHTENIQTEEYNKQVQDALNSLEPELKEVVVLKDIEGLSYADVSKTLNISVSTVRTNLGKGRKILKGKLKDLL